MNKQSPALRLECQHPPALLGTLHKRLSTNHSLTLTKPERCQASLLDTSIDSLWGSGRLLLKAGRQLLLLTPTETRRLKTGAQTPAFASEISDTDFRAALAKVPPLRSLQPRLDVALTSYKGILRNARGKPILTLQFTNLATDAAPAPTLIEVYAPQPLHRQAKAFIKLLKKNGTQHNDNLGHLLPAYQGTGYRANPGVSLPSGISVLQATNTMISTYIGVARQNEAGIIADWDTEYLHDYRVSLRRVRSIISLYKGAYETTQQQQLKYQLSELMRGTNRLRDLDSYLLGQSVDYADLPASLHPGLDAIFAAFARERRSEWQTLSRQLSGTSYQQEMQHLQRQFSPEGELREGPRAHNDYKQNAARLIRKQYRKVCRLGAKIDEQTPDSTVHELRLACKKLRYLLDLSGPLFAKAKVKVIIKKLKRLQDNLGRFNDFSVQQIALQEFLDHQLSDDPKTEIKLIEAVGALVAIRYQRQIHERALIIKSVRQFQSSGSDTLIAQALEVTSN